MTGGADTPMARMRKALHRARTGVRKAGVDYFRGQGSDRLALTLLLLPVPAIACGTIATPRGCAPSAPLLAPPPVWSAPSPLVRPIVAGGLLLRPASLLTLYAAAATALIVESAVLGPYTEEDTSARVTPGTILVVAAVGFSGLLIAQFR